MGFLEKLFGRKDKGQALSPFNNRPPVQASPLNVHPDLQSLIWFADGPLKNYFPNGEEETINCNGVVVVYSSFPLQEPSLISTHLPIKERVDPQRVDNPPYYPSYSGLSSAQRGVYWQFLKNPYDGEFNIGYVFLFYYGLERHLIEGNYEEAFRTIIKLRDVYDNPSFQHYSACALILTCLMRHREDLAMEFYNSIDKDYEFKFSHNLYLLCKMGLNRPLDASDIIRMAKTFEFDKQNYIKKYPDLFSEKLSSIMLAKWSSGQLNISDYITSSEWKKLKKQAVPVFANLSLNNKTVDVPLLSESFKLKKTIFDLLDAAHEETKKSLAEMRKNGAVPAEKGTSPQKIVEVRVLDKAKEKELLRQYKKLGINAMDKHFALISLQDFYYKYRDVDEKYLQICIDYCLEDIELLPKVQSQYIKEEQDSIQKLAQTYSKKELSQKLSSVTSFKGNIPAFRRLAIIYEKRNDFSAAINICQQAIAYYSSVQMYETVSDFEARKAKIENKVSKNNQ